MEDEYAKEILSRLNEDALLWLKGDYPCNATLPIEAATCIETLMADVEHWKSMLTEAVNDIKELAAKCNDAPCIYCKHYQTCDGEECSEYISGRGCADEKGNYVDWKWSCEDFTYGDCPKLENTPCHNCGTYDHFEWRGLK